MIAPPPPPSPSPSSSTSHSHSAVSDSALPTSAVLADVLSAFERAISSSTSTSSSSSSSFSSRTDASKMRGRTTMRTTTIPCGGTMAGARAEEEKGEDDDDDDEYDESMILRARLLSDLLTAVRRWNDGHRRATTTTTTSLSFSSCVASAGRRPVVDDDDDETDDDDDDDDDDNNDEDDDDDDDENDRPARTAKSSFAMQPSPCPWDDPSMSRMRHGTMDDVECSSTRGGGVLFRVEETTEPYYHDMGESEVPGTDVQRPSPPPLALRSSSPSDDPSMRQLIRPRMADDDFLECEYDGRRTSCGTMWRRECSAFAGSEPYYPYQQSAMCVGETEVPGTDMQRPPPPPPPPPAPRDPPTPCIRPMMVDDDDGPTIIWPRRARASSSRRASVRTIDRASSPPNHGSSPFRARKRKKPRATKNHGSMHHIIARSANATDAIRRGDKEDSESMAMSPLTCDVNAYPIVGSSGEGRGRKYGLGGYETGRFACPSRKQTMNTNGCMNLYVAYDVLDPVEIRALEMMRNRGYLRVVFDGIRGVTIELGRCNSSFPAILVTYGIDMPGGPTTCHRSYAYLKAVVLGAIVVDARWLVDSKHAGILIDCEKYVISIDSESHYRLLADQKYCGEAAYDSLTTVLAGISTKTLSGKLDGITLGLLRDDNGSPPLEYNERHESKLDSQMYFETGRIATQEITSLVEFLGGRITTNELEHSDIILVDDWMTLKQITKALQSILFGNVGRWSIRKCTIGELNDFIVDGSDCAVGNCGRIPIIRCKWLEDSICLRSLECLESYCWGILCLR